MKKQFELDFLGQYYAGIVNEKLTGVFSIAVHLNESLNHKILKQTLADLVQRFPFLSGGLRSNFFWYEYEITKGTLPLIPVEKITDPMNSEQIFRVFYGERHFIVEVNHLLCDGRTLSKIARILVIQYFEILGINISNTDKAIFDESLHPEELENAYLRFANTKIKKTDDQPKTSVYHPPASGNTPVRTLTYKLSASKVKAEAKAYEVTVSGFLLSLIFKSVAVERAVFNREEPITASIPIDCRSFFPSKTMRNFVSAQTIMVPEGEDFTDMIKQLQIEFTKIDKHFVLEDFSSFQKSYQRARYLPRKIKNWYMKRMNTLESTKHTTGLSNIGKIDLPETVLNHIDFMEFFISLEEAPYYFSCVTAGNILALTVTLKTDTDVLVEELENNLNKNCH